MIVLERSARVSWQRCVYLVGIRVFALQRLADASSRIGWCPNWQRLMKKQNQILSLKKVRTDVTATAFPQTRKHLLAPSESHVSVLVKFADRYLACADGLCPVKVSVRRDLSKQMELMLHEYVWLRRSTHESTKGESSTHATAFLQKPRLLCGSKFDLHNPAVAITPLKKKHPFSTTTTKGKDCRLSGKERQGRRRVERRSGYFAGNETQSSRVPVLKQQRFAIKCIYNNSLLSLKIFF